MSPVFLLKLCFWSFWILSIVKYDAYYRYVFLKDSGQIGPVWPVMVIAIAAVIYPSPAVIDSLLIQSIRLFCWGACHTKKLESWCRRVGTDPILKVKTKLQEELFRDRIHQVQKLVVEFNYYGGILSSNRTCKEVEQKETEGTKRCQEREERVEPTTSSISRRSGMHHNSGSCEWQNRSPNKNGSSLGVSSSILRQSRVLSWSCCYLQSEYFMIIMSR